ncbi:MAG TPA: radical SAM protein [Clostridia bacterium]|nr:radical SAM protein [Clostridia bacterium]
MFSRVSVVAMTLDAPRTSEANLVLETDLSVTTLSPSAKRSDLKIIQPETTFTGGPILKIKKGLPKETQSLCPECSKVIAAREFEENGKVMMDKTCPEHGYFKDCVYSDVALYLKMEEWEFGDSRGLENPAINKGADSVCPDDCGLCSLHTSHSALANVDLTNRCNLTCPVCFANANAAGYLYEPDMDGVRVMLQALRDERPVAGRVVQFSGGEPTIHPNFVEICAMAREMGFSHIQAATNGLMIGASLEFTQRCKAAGLATLYLQFDGVTDDVYRKTRGEPLFEKKMACIENCRKAGIKIVFVPTIVKGVNDHELGAILKVAIDNVDTVSGISFQPVAFTGRIARKELEEKRFTLPDMAFALSEQTGMFDKYNDWFPLSAVTPFSKLMAAIRGAGVPTISCHPHCSLGTYMFVDEKSGKAVPVTQFVDMPGMLQDIEKLAQSAEKSFFKSKYYHGAKAFLQLNKHFKQEFAPPGLTFQKFLDTLQGMTDKKLGRDGMDGTFTYRTLLVAGMHFMDHHNYDVERVKRCVIQYAAPNGKLYPFCTYNSGPTYREKIEKEFSMPFEQQLKRFGFAPAASKSHAHGAHSCECSSGTCCGGKKDA